MENRVFHHKLSSPERRNSAFEPLQAPDCSDRPIPRELADITKAGYPKIKIVIDVICLAVTALLTFIFLGRLYGLGIGTVLAAFTMGKMVGIVGNLIDRKFSFTSFLSK